MFHVVSAINHVANCYWWLLQSLRSNGKTLLQIAILKCIIAINEITVANITASLNPASPYLQFCSQELFNCFSLHSTSNYYSPEICGLQKIFATKSWFSLNICYAETFVAVKYEGANLHYHNLINREMLKNLKKNENDKEDENMLLDHDLYEVMLLVYQHLTCKARTDSILLGCWIASWL